MKSPACPGMQYAHVGTSDGLSLALQTSLPLEPAPASAPSIAGGVPAADPRRAACILLLHGFSGSSAYFARNYAALAQAHWVVAPDLRGHGASGRSAGGFHVARLALDLRAVVAALQRAAGGGGGGGGGSGSGAVVAAPLRICAVGCSLGAAVLWTYVELFGDGDFAGFVFADQAPLQDRSPFGGGWDARRAHRGCFDERSLRAAQRAWIETPAAAHGGLVRECLGYRCAPEASDAVSAAQAARDEAFFTGISRLCDGTWLARLLADHTRYDHREAVELITKPTLVMAGRRTGCFPLEGLKETVRRVEKGSGKPELAKWSVFDGGHWMFYEEPERFNRELLAFVKECIAPSL